MLKYIETAGSLRMARLAIVASLSLAIALAGCGGGSSGTETNTLTPSNPAPSVTSISPSSVTAGGGAFTLTVNGTNFISTSVIEWNGQSQTTSYVSATQLTASIPSSDIASGGTASVTVVNPAPGGGTSSAVSFTYNDPVPAVTSLSPSSAVAGASPFILTVNGSNFVSTSTIQWNGNTRTTTFISPTQLSTPITSADVAAGQNAVVAVTNPTPGGGTSAEVNLVVSTPAPTVASISPASAVAGGASFTLTVSGSNFLPGSTVQWNGNYGQPPLATTYVSSTELTVAVPASDIAFAGDANVTVLNPAPGGGTSQAGVFTITGSVPANVSFVAPNGNDSNTGTMANPYLTIQKCATTVPSGSTCAIRAGTYRETVTPNSGITITSYDGEPVTMDGSDPVTGWTVYQGSIYKASVVLSTGDTNQIFVGNQMMTEARWPNGNDLFHVNWATLGTGTTTTQVVDPNLPNINWRGAKIHLWSGTDAWDPQTGTVTVSSQGQLTFSPDGANTCPYICPQAGGYYYLYRTLAALDAQNEWFYDPDAMMLYFWAPGGVNPSTLDATAKQRQYAFDLSGDSNVTIEHLNLFASTINTNSSSTNNSLDSINAEYVSQYTDLTIIDPMNPFPGWDDHTMDSGIILNGSGNILRNSVVGWSAGNGVALLGSNNTLTNNLILDTGYVGNDASGISLYGSGHEVQYNSVHQTGRMAVYPSYNFDTDINSNNNDISYNNLFGAMALSRDAGEIYAGGGTVTNDNIHNNWLHDTQTPYANLLYFPDGMSGVYIDSDESGWSIYQNVLWNNQFDSVFLLGSSNGTTSQPNNNDVYNNTIPDVGTNAFIRTKLTAACGTTQIVNNLVLVAVSQEGTVCSATDDTSTAPGATQMTTSVQVGCNFAGCSSEGPPAVSGTSVAASIAVQPYNMSVTAGQPVTFTVTGAGSPTLTYQWQRNGANITGATSATYTITSASAADNGAAFTVTVSNSLGSVTSNPASLTVQ